MAESDIQTWAKYNIQYSESCVKLQFRGVHFFGQNDIQTPFFTIRPMRRLAEKKSDLKLPPKTFLTTLKPCGIASAQRDLSIFEKQILSPKKRKNGKSMKSHTEIQTSNFPEIQICQTAPACLNFCVKLQPH